MTTEQTNQSAPTPGVDNPLMNALIGSRKFFTPRATMSEDKREIHYSGGRQGDSF